MNVHHWDIPTAIKRQADAADFWMEITGRKQAAAFGVAKEAMEKVAADLQGQEPAQLDPSLTRPLKWGAGAGAALGATAAGLAAHAHNRVGEFARIPRRYAALGGGAIGAGLGTAAGIGLLVHKIRKSAQEQQVPQKTASLSLSARVAGGAAGAVPAGIIGFLNERSRHRPGAVGKSRFEIKSERALAEHLALMAHRGKPSKLQELKKRFLELQLRGAVEGRESPNKAALIGMLPYMLAAGSVGAGVAPKVAPWLTP